MIQRIQSIYLLLAAILMAATAFSPILVLGGGEGEQILFSYGIWEGNKIIKPTWGIVSIAGLVSFIAFIAIFMFKHRKKQMNVVKIAIGLVLFFYVTTAVYVFSYYTNFIDVFSSIAYGVILPILALILFMMSIGKIKKDEKLVRSLDRIR